MSIDTCRSFRKVSFVYTVDLSGSFERMRRLIGNINNAVKKRALQNGNKPLRCPDPFLLNFFFAFIFLNGNGFNLIISAEYDS